MDKMKFLRILLIILIVIGSVSLGIILSGDEKAGEEKAVVFSQSAGEPEECQVEVEERIVRGSSLDPLIKNGEIVKVLFGYYGCNEIQRNDIVLYSYAGNENPIIKIVRGVPGDSYELKKAGFGEWHILINGQVLKNSEGKSYSVSGNKYKMLSLYEDDCENGIPPNTYLILGNLVSGSQDSTRFGLIDKSDILGKAVW